MAKFHWHGALRSAHKSCTHGHVSWKKGGKKRELVSAHWTSSRRFSHMLYSKAHNHQLLRACLPGSKRKLPPPACQTELELPSVVCRLRGMQFPGSVYTCNQGPLSSAWAHCTSYAPSAYSLCRRCCCCPLQCDKQCIGTRLNSAGDPVPYHKSWSLSFLHLLSALSPPFLLSRSKAFWHIPPSHSSVKSLLTHSSNNDNKVIYRHEKFLYYTRSSHRHLTLQGKELCIYFRTGSVRIWPQTFRILLLLISVRKPQQSKFIYSNRIKNWDFQNNYHNCRSDRNFCLIQYCAQKM